MKLITENRTEMIRALKEIEPRKIISFSWVNESLFNEEKGLMVIINTRQYFENPTRILTPKNWLIRTNNKIHAKIAIGLKGVIIGSWNFSNNSTQNYHEAIVKFEKNEAPDIEKHAADYFERLWNRSSDV